MGFVRMWGRLFGMALDESDRAGVWCRRGLRIGAAAIILSILNLAPYFTSSTEVVRMRNALLVLDGPDSDFTWTPSTRPAGFELDSVPPYPMFVEAVRNLQLDALPDDWARSVVISRHLLASHKPLVGGAIQSDLRTTYRRIIERGEGYCADFVRVFSAMAVTAGIPVRSWAFSFDGFGGHGHVFPEIWNRQLGRWQLVSVFNNLEVVGAKGQPLSALEVRRALLERSTSIQLRPLVASVPPAFIHEEKAWQYYRNGAPQWYLWWGNSPFTYDSAWSVRTFEGTSRSLAQLGAILQGVHPRIRILATEQNAPQVAALRRLRTHLLVSAAGIVAGATAMAVCAGLLLIRRRRESRASGRVGPSYGA
jgi:hypothetical protein